MKLLRQALDWLGDPPQDPYVATDLVVTYEDCGRRRVSTNPAHLARVMQAQGTLGELEHSWAEQWKEQHARETGGIPKTKYVGPGDDVVAHLLPGRDYGRLANPPVFIALPRADEILHGDGFIIIRKVT